MSEFAKVFVDLSNYQKFFNFRLYKEMGGKIVWVKSSMQLGFDPGLFERAEQIKAEGLELGLYHWIDPIPASTNFQVDLFCQAIERTKPNYIAGDNEQWWDRWPAVGAGRLSDAKIDRFAKEFMYKIHYAYPDTPLYLYTSHEFVKTYNPSSRKWLHKYPLWVASYAMNPMITFDSLQTIENYALNLPAPRIPAGADEWAIRQFGDEIIVPGLNHYNGIDHVLDWNLVNTGLPNTEPPAPVDPGEYIEAQLKSWVFHLNVRPFPGTANTPIRMLNQGDVIKLEKRPMVGWVKLWGEEGYVHSSYIEVIES